MQVRIAKWRLGGNGRLLLSPKFSAYLAFAASTSSRILVIAVPPVRGHNGAVAQSCSARLTELGLQCVAKRVKFYWFTVAKNCVTCGSTRSLRKWVSAWPRPGKE